MALLSRQYSSGIGTIRPIVALRVVNPATGEREAIYALLDSAADRDYLSVRVAKKLKLPVKRVTMNLVTVEDSSRRERMVGMVEFHSMDGSYEAKLNDVLIGYMAQATPRRTRVLSRPIRYAKLGR